MDGEVFTLFDIPIQRLGFYESLHAVLTGCRSSATRVFFVDAYSLVLAQENRSYKRCLQLAEYCFGQGRALDLAARFLNEPPLPANIDSTEWVTTLFDRLDNAPRQERTSVFCLGGRPKAVDSLASELKTRWPRITLAAHFHENYPPEEEERIVDLIEQKSPTVLLLGMETQREQQFICRHWHRLKQCGVKIAIGGGQTIDAVAGTLPIMPHLARAIHLEWIFQMILEPQRFYHHYLRCGPSFAWFLIKQKGMNEQK